jgi:hypothetical protein
MHDRLLQVKLGKASSEFFVCRFYFWFLLNGKKLANLFFDSAQLNNDDQKDYTKKRNQYFKFEKT